MLEYQVVCRCVCRLLMLVSFGCIVVPLFSQPPSISYIPAELFPLPSEDKTYQHYDLELDERGFVYSASPSGILRFDGSTMRKISTVEAVFTGLYKDYANGLWTRTLNQGVAIVKSDSLVPFKYNDDMSDLWRVKLTDLYLDSDSTLHIGTRGRGYHTITASGAREEKVNRRERIHGWVVTRLPDGKLFHWSVHLPESINAHEPQAIYYLHSNGELSKVTQHFDKADISFESSLIEHKDGSWTLSTGDQNIIRAIGDSLLEKHLFPYPVIKLFHDTRGGLWIGTRNHGLHRVLDGNLAHYEHLLGEEAAAVTAEDSRGGLWVKSEKHGFVYIPNPSVKIFSRALGHLPSEFIDIMVSDQKRVFLVNRKEGVIVLTKDSAQNIGFPEKVRSAYNLVDFSSMVTGVALDTVTGDFWIASMLHLAKWDGGKWEVFDLDHPQWTGHRLSGLFVVGSDSLVLVAHDKVATWKNGHWQTLLNDSLKEKKVIATAMDSRGRLWVSTSSGQLMALDSSGWSTMKPPESAGQKPAGLILRQLVCIGGRVVGITRDYKGFSIKDGVVERLKYENGEPVYMGECLPIHSETMEFWGRFFKGSIAPIGRFRIKKDLVSADRYFLDDMPLNFLTQSKLFAVADSQVFIGTDYGFFTAPLNELVESGPPISVYFTDISVNYQSQELLPSYRLPHEKNLINLKFAALSFRIAPPKFRCRLIGFDSMWVAPDYQGIQYTNLAPGSYTFQVQAHVRSEDWGMVKEVNFFIEKPYWQTLWFQILMGLLLIVLIFGVFNLVLRRKEQKNRLIIEKLIAEQQALRSQMNPHFVYNALNSSLKFLFSGKTDDYQRLTTELSKLLRTGLENSRSEFISLQREIDFLENYLEVETQRFPGRFQFRLHVEDDLNDDLDAVSLPPMMIQPMLENAIKHAPAEQQVRIEVFFSMHDDNSLRVEVRDNGLGISPDRLEEVKKQQSSLGINILFSRIELLRKQNFKASVTIEYLDASKKKGTRVVLIIPIQ